MKSEYWKQLIILLSFTVIIYLFLLNNKTKIEGFTSSEDINFYVFYTNSCPHSKKFFKDNWDILRKKYGNNIIFNKIDCNDPNMKAICNSFEVKSVPAIYLIKENGNKIPYKGVRSLDNLEVFLKNNINNGTNTSNNLNKKESFASERKPTMDDPVDFEQYEDMNNKKYKYCINYRDSSLEKYNKCQLINEKETPNLKAWQGAYSALSEYLSNVNDKRTIAFKHKDDIANWHLCNPILLQSIKQNIESMSNNKNELDINDAIQYACGFNKK
jgi:hypothetical protein